VKPNSIKLFDYFYLGSIFLGFLGFATGYFSAGAPVSYVIAYFVGEVIRLILWYLLSRRRSIIAKWIIVALFLLSLISVGGLFVGSMALSEIYALAGLVAQAVAVGLLFRSDSIRWLNSRDADEAPPRSDA